MNANYLFRDVVQLLLCYEASANVIDSKGCYPLHLAAWNGNSEICRILLTHGPSTAKVNEQVGQIHPHFLQMVFKRSTLVLRLQFKHIRSVM